jgi:hypothetical protein
MQIFFMMMKNSQGGLHGLIGIHSEMTQDMLRNIQIGKAEKCVEDLAYPAEAMQPRTSKHAAVQAISYMYVCLKKTKKTNRLF